MAYKEKTGMHLQSATVLIACLFLASACRQQRPTAPPGENSASSAKDIPEAHSVDKLEVANFNRADSFRSFINSLSKTDVQSSLKGAEKFYALFNSSAGQEADESFVVFDDFYKKLKQNLQNYLLGQKEDYSLFITDSSKVTASMKRFRDQLHANGFRFIYPEGMPAIEENRDFFQQKFYPFVSPVMKTYFRQLEKENNEGFASDASIIIKPESFADRVVWWEKFSSANTGFTLAQQAKKYRSYYLFYFLYGMNNTPLQNYKTGAPEPYFSKAYQYLLSTHAETSAAKLVKPFYELLKAGKYAEAKKLRSGYEAQGLIDATAPQMLQ